MSTVSTENLLACGKGRRPIPGKGFKAKIDGKWQDYSSDCNRFLQKAYEAGCPSMRLNVRGHMYKFDFKSMVQKNLSTLEASEMRAPHDAERYVRSSCLKMENLRHPRSKGYKALREKVRPQRPVFVVRVPAGGPGNTIRVPHPKKLGKPMVVFVPAEAEVGQALFLPMPRTEIKSKVKYAAAGTMAGTTGTAAGVVISEGIGGAIAGGAAISVGSALALGLGGVAVVGAVVGAGAAVHYATRNPSKAVAIGALTIGGLVLIDHVAEVGVMEATGDVAEGVGDALESAGDFAEGAFDVAEDVGEAFLHGADWLGDVAEHGVTAVDIVAELF